MLQTRNWEPGLFAVLAAVVVVPTALLLTFGLQAVGRARLVFETQIRDTYRQTAANVVAATLWDMEGRADGALETLGAFLEDADPEKRLQIQRLAGFSNALVALDENWRPLYPRRDPVAPLSASFDAPAEVAAARKAAFDDDPRDAQALYRRFLSKTSPETPAHQQAANELAQLLLKAGAKEEALAIYETLCSLPDAGGELHMPLLARFCIWRLDPSGDNLLALAGSCLENALVAPPAQLRYCLRQMALEAPPDVVEILRAVTSVLDLRAADEKLLPSAAYLAGSGADSSTATSWSWVSHRGASGLVIAAARKLDLGEAGGALVLVGVDLEEVESQLTRRLGESQRADALTEYRLETEPPDAISAHAEADDVAFSEALPAPFEFWRLAVAVPGGDLGALAEARMRLLSWAMGLAGISTVAGVAIVILWARRRARLARLQTDFVANVTHELKTPLTAIKSLAETVLFERLTAAEKRGEFLSAIVHESDRLGRLINNVLDFSKLDSGGVRLHVAPADLAAVVETVTSAFKAALPENESACVELSVPDEPLVAQVDSDMVARTLFNLLDNAYKYSEPPRRIEVCLSHGDGRAVLSVSDNGVGLTASERRRIFRKFYRADTALSARTQGAGLGLALVNAYVRAHGGSVAVASTPGDGSIFTITIPLIRPEAKK